MWIKKLYYYLTALVPRSLPRNEGDWDRLKYTLVRYFGLSDSPEVWATITSHVCAFPLRIPYAHASYSYLASVGKKLAINECANVEKSKHMKVLKQKFEDKMAADAKQYMIDHPEEAIQNAKDIENQQAAETDRASNS